MIRLLHDHQAGLLLAFYLFIFTGLGVVSDRSHASQQEFEIALRQLEQVTGLNFKQDVSLEHQTRDEFQVFLRQEMKKSFPGDELKFLGQIYGTIGFLPESYRLEERLPDLYREQVGAYYDPETKKIYQVAGDLPSASQFFLYLHEGMHALQDQHYNLKAKQEKFSRGASLDQQLAFAFVVEGHANLVATAAQMNAQKLNNDFFGSAQYEYIFQLTSRLTNLSSAQLEAITSMFAGQDSPTGRSLQKLRGVPLILVQQMSDPYLVGQNLWFQKAKRHGFETANTWLEDIPGSTRELFFDSTGVPGKFESEATPGKFETRFGSYLMMRWLKTFSTRPAWAQALRSDRISLVGDSDVAVVWEIEFDDEQGLAGFKRDLSPFLTSADEEENGSGVTFQREGETRYFWYKENGSSVTLFLDDDPRIEPELQSAGFDSGDLQRSMAVSDS